MSIFVVIEQNQRGPKGTLDAAIRGSTMPSYPVKEGVWLVALGGTARELCDNLGITPDGDHGTAVVTEVSSYFGRANPAIWSWMKQNWEGSPLG